MIACPEQASRFDAPQIETRLALPAGCLAPLLPQPVLRHRGPAKAGFPCRFTLGNIDVFHHLAGHGGYAVVIGAQPAGPTANKDLALRNEVSAWSPCGLMSRRSTVARSSLALTNALPPCNFPWSRFSNAHLSSGPAGESGALSQSQGVLEVVVAEPRAFAALQRVETGCNSQPGAGATLPVAGTDRGPSGSPRWGWASSSLER